MKLHPGAVPEGVILRTLAAALAPRPLALVSTVSAEGVVNVAPFSMVTPLSASPPLVGLSIHPRGPGAGEPKDTLRNIEAGGDFVINAVTAELLERAVWAAAEFPADVSEAWAVGLEVVPSDLVRAPRIAASPVNLECRLTEIFRPAGSRASFVVGEVRCLHVDDSLVREGELDPERFRPVAHVTSLPGRYVFATIGSILAIEPLGISAAGAPAPVSHPRPPRDD